MKVMLFFIFLAIVNATYSILSNVVISPTSKNIKAFKTMKRKNKIKNSIIQDFINFLGPKIAKFIHIEDELDRERFKNTLINAEIYKTPEEYIGGVIADVSIVVIVAGIVFFISPPFSFSILIFSVYNYFNQMKLPEKIIKEKKKQIEAELPRFTNQISEELKNSSDLIEIFRKYIKSAGNEMKNELEITLADMRSGNSEIALGRMEARIGSTMMSEIIRGLIAIKRGDDGRSYFSNLSMVFRQQEIQNLKKEALKLPEKINKYSITIAILFVIMYMLVLGIDTVGSFVNMI